MTVMMIVKLLAEAHIFMGASPMQASNDELHNIVLVQGTPLLPADGSEPSAGGLMCLAKALPAPAVLFNRLAAPVVPSFFPYRVLPQKLNVPDIPSVHLRYAHTTIPHLYNIRLAGMPAFHIRVVQCLWYFLWAHALSSC